MWFCFCSQVENYAAAAAAKSLQSCLTLCNPTDVSPPGSPVPGILQVRTLEWVAISFSNAWTWKVKVKSLSRVWLFATPWTAAHQAPPSMGFSRQEYWSGVPLPSPVENYRVTEKHGRVTKRKSSSFHRETHLCHLVASDWENSWFQRFSQHWNEGRERGWKSILLIITTVTTDC